MVTAKHTGTQGRQLDGIFVWDRQMYITGSIFCPHPISDLA